MWTKAWEAKADVPADASDLSVKPPPMKAGTRTPPSK
jgi:hypothetical protein